MQLRRKNVRDGFDQARCIVTDDKDGTRGESEDEQEGGEMVILQCPVDDLREYEDGRHGTQCEGCKKEEVQIGDRIKEGGHESAGEEQRGVAESGEQGGDRYGHTDQHHEDDTDRVVIDDYVRTLERGDGDHDAHDGHPDDER